MSEPKVRRHGFRSFKERVDAMKIEPSRKLNTRAHDYVESSHFLATLQHWKEVNISGDFTEFCLGVEPLCQSLPQILHHQKQIFSLLQKHIVRNDVNSIQPLLELLAQFIHDLGPDFMVFYPDFLHLITDLARQTAPSDAQNMRNTSNVLEWSFNALAFAFKYLGRALTQDLVPTFRLLLPVLQMTKKTYVARFCAEALSFLVKKLSPEVLAEAVRFLFNENAHLLVSNRHYRESMVVLYSEAMKNTKETFHSKALAVFSVLIENALDDAASSDACVSGVCDILLQVARHGLPQACERFYSTCVTFLERVASESPSQDRLIHVVQLLIAMCFFESGKKIPDWLAVLSVVDSVAEKAETAEKTKKAQKKQKTQESKKPLNAQTPQTTSTATSSRLWGLLAHLFAVVVRNCPMEQLLKHFERMVSLLLARNTNRYFLSFYEMAVVHAPEKMATFGASKALQRAVNASVSDDDLVVLSQKLQTLPATSVESIVLPVGHVSSLLELMETDIKKPFCTPVMRELFWKLQLLQFAPDMGVTNSTTKSAAKSTAKTTNERITNEVPTGTPLRILHTLGDRSLPPSAFLHDVLGNNLSVAVRLSAPNASAASELYSVVQTCLESCRASLDFLVGATRLLQKHGAILARAVRADIGQICRVMASNFSLPSRTVRVQTAQFLTQLYRCSNTPVPFVLSQIHALDEVPLTIANANDVKMRIRQMVTEFAAQGSPSRNDTLQLSHYVVGLLSNSYQPCWLAVYEMLPQLAEAGCAETLWLVLMGHLRLDYLAQEQQQYTSDDADEGQESAFADEEAGEDMEDDMDIDTETDTGSKGVTRAMGATPFFDVLDENLAASIAAATSSIFPSATAALAAILGAAQHKFTKGVAYNTQVRSRVIKALQAMAYVVEQHGAEFVEFAVQLQQSENDDLEPKYANFDSWAAKDKLALVAVCGKFKKMRKIPGNERLFELVLENLSLKQTAVQQESLEVLFAWNKPAVNKYRDNLKNLLEDKLFRDELQLLVNKTGDSKIEEADAPEVIPVVLRILYGRAKGASNNKGKNGRKFAIATILPNLPDQYIQQFLAILCHQLPYAAYFETGIVGHVSKRQLTGMVGYLNMLYEVYSGLGYKFAHLLRGTLQPLAYTLVAAQHVLDSDTKEAETGEDRDNKLTQIENENDVDPSTVENQHLTSGCAKVARAVRTLGFKCLDHFFKITTLVHEWTAKDTLVVYESIVRPRLVRFSQENAQQPLSLMALVLGWIQSPLLVGFLYLDDFAPVVAVMELLGNPHAKDTVKMAILDFCIAAFTHKDAAITADDNYSMLLALVVDALLAVLPPLIETSIDKEMNARAATLLLLIIEGGYVKEHATKTALVHACASAIRRPPTQMGQNDRVSLLLSLVAMLDGYECTFDDIASLYQGCSVALRLYKDRHVREALVQLFLGIGARFDAFADVGQVLADLNSYLKQRLVEPDFERRLKGFRRINDHLYLSLNPTQWLPLVQACLFFINDPEESVIRTNASYTLVRFVEALALKIPGPELDEFTQLFRSVVDPQLRLGLKKDSPDIKEGYIHVLGAAVKCHACLPEFASMSVLLLDDPEQDFFNNITHIQTQCKVDAIQSLGEARDSLEPDCIFHYILPMTESYTEGFDDKARAILNATHITWEQLLSKMHWHHFRQLTRRRIVVAGNSEGGYNRDRLRLVVRLSQGMRESFNGSVGGGLSGVPDDPERVEATIMRELFEPIMAIVRLRSDETVEKRSILVEAAVNFLLCVSETTAQAAIAGTLTNMCQGLRARYQPTREGLRKILCKVAVIVGPRYFRFIVLELKSALSRGAQIHVLSYTLHAVLVATRDTFEEGDLDELAPLIVDVLMEDIFGAAGQDKDAEEYRSAITEVKAQRSFDTGELLCSNISLSAFHYVIEPIKMLLRVNIPVKTRNKLDRLLLKYSQGLLHNPAAALRDVLILCYELHLLTRIALDAEDNKSGTHAKATRNNPDEDHFLVQPEVRAGSASANASVDKAQVVYTLQKLSFDLLRTSLTKNKELMTAANLNGFVPLMATSLAADDEGLLVALFRFLTLIAPVALDEKHNAFFSDSAARAFDVIQNAASTGVLIAQICLRYLAVVMQHKPAVQLSHGALTYLLLRLLPDLEDLRQHVLAFAFLQVVVDQHVMLPEVYEVMEKVSSIMVVNHSREVRRVSRELYFQFLMEYEQAPARLDRAFKFLVSNLAYPTQSGRESVMELMHLIVADSSEALVAQLATSFFVGLANVAVSDDALKCREMASALLALLFEKVGLAQTKDMESFIHSWMLQTANPLLRRCGLTVYKIYLSVFGWGSSERLDSLALGLVQKMIALSRNGAEDEEESGFATYTRLDPVGKDEAESNTSTSTNWQHIYTAMSVFSGMCTALGPSILAKRFEGIWRDILDSLLYPHTWVRLLAARLVGVLLGNIAQLQFKVLPEELQTLAYRHFRQLQAPVVAPELGTQVVKNMIQLVTKWEQEQTPFFETAMVKDDQENGRKHPDNAEIEVVGESTESAQAQNITQPTESAPRYKLALDFVVVRVCSLMRLEPRADRLLVARKLAIQLAAVIGHVVPKEKLPPVSRQLLLGMYYILESHPDTEAEDEVLDMAKECAKALEDKLGVLLYSEVLSAVRKEVDQRRHERKVKRTQLAMTAPDVVARKKLRKHERENQKRKRKNDSNEYYRDKRETRVKRVKKERNMKRHGV